MGSNLRKAYSEIYEILNLIEKEYTDKIPNKLKEFFKTERDNDFVPNINIDKPLENQNLQNDTLTILAILYLNYWYESEEEKQELINLFNEVDKQNSEKYKVDNIFKKKQATINNIEEDVDNSLVIIKENFFRKIINKIKKLFKKTI